jgi:hypothetical protein
VARRRRGGAVPGAPAACRVGGLGGRAQGRAEHAVLHAHPGELRALRRASRARALPGDRRLFRPRSGGQADAGHAPLPAAAPRLVAPRAPGAGARATGARPTCCWRKPRCSPCRSARASSRSRPRPPPG